MNKINCAVIAVLVLIVGTYAAEVTPSISADGVYTYYADAGVTNTVSTPVPSAASKVVKTGQGAVRFTVAADAGFAGSVEILEGTAELAHFDALGLNSVKNPFTVKEGATLYVTATDGSSFTGHHLTIGGSGVNGNGALVYKGKWIADGLGNTILTSDTTFNVQNGMGLSQWSTLDLATHTLTQIGSSAFIIYKTVKNGHLHIKAGTLIFEKAGSFEGPAEGSSIIVDGGVLRNNGFSGRISVPIIMMDSASNKNPTLEVANGKMGSGLNRIDGDIVLVGNYSPRITFAKRTDGVIPEANVYGMVTNKGSVTDFSLVDWYLASSVNFYGGMYLGDGTLSSSAQYAKFQGEDKQWQMGYFNLRNGCFTVQDGTLMSDLSFRVVGDADTSAGAGATLHLLDANLICSPLKGTWVDPVRIAGYPSRHKSSMNGCLYLENSDVMIEHIICVGCTTNDYGVVIQKGGNFQLGTSNGRDPYLHFGGKQSPTFGYSAALLYQNGGTNSTCVSRYGNKRRFDFSQYQATSEVEEGESFCPDTFMTVTGKDALFVTEKFSFGTATSWTTNILNVNDGAVFAANRFNKYENDSNSVIVNMNGGVLKPMRYGSWCDSSPGSSTDTAFFKIGPNHTIVYEKGMTIDSSEAFNETSGELEYVYINFGPEDATGQGIATITLPEDLDRTAYKMPALIRIQGSGYGASAFVDYDFENMCLSNQVTITSAGCNYQEGDLKVYIESADRKTLHECAYTLKENVAGPVCFKGKKDSPIHVFGEAKWTGETIVDETTLIQCSWVDNTLPQGTAYYLRNGGVLDLRKGEFTASSLGGYGSVIGKDVTVTDRLKFSCEDLFSGKYLTVAKKLTLEKDVKLVITDADKLDDYKYSDAATVVMATEGLDTSAISSGIPQIVFDGEAETAASWKLYKRGANALAFGVPKGTVILIR